MYRFTETNKWNDPWFRKLKASEKIVFIYIIDNCNNAGFYEIDIDMMSFQIGLDKAKIEGAIEGLNRGLLGAKNWVWVKNFLKHQKNWPLNPDNNAHRQIINLMIEQKENFIEVEYFIEKLGAIEGLISPIGKGRGKGIGKVKVDKPKKPKKFEPPNIEDFTLYFTENGYPKELADKAFSYYSSADWHDRDGKPVLNWKQKVIANWFKEESKHKNGNDSQPVIRRGNHDYTR